MSRWLIALPPILFLILVSAFYFGMQRGNPQDIPSTFIGRQAPSFPTTALPGYALATDADLRNGQVTLVNFWASWCPPCRAEHPTLHELAERGIPLIGVNMMDHEDNAISYLVDSGNPFTGIVTDPKGRNRLEWGVTAPPETFIIDGAGNVLFRFIGPLVGSDYEQRFVPALEAALAQK